METPALPASIVGARRNEDIALDLLKFVASVTEIGKPAGVGFQNVAGGKSQDQADRLLELYGRCLSAVQGHRK